MNDQHDHDHDHSHGHHGHSHAPANFGRAFAIGVALNSGFVVLEVVYGLFAHSLALVADAGHNLSDVFGLLMAWGAAVWAQRPPTPRYTYGWRRSSVLAALANAIFLLVSVGVIAWEAIRRLNEPANVSAPTIIWVAAAGIVVNAVTAIMFMSGRKHDLNIRGAYLHMAADALISAGVVVAGIGILFTGWQWLDPVVSLVLVAVIIFGTWGLLRDSFNLAVDAVPPGIDITAVRDFLAGLPNVANVHHLHVWGLSTSEVALTAHVVLDHDNSDNALLRRINHDLHEQFDIDHATIQFESRANPCCVGEDCASAHPHEVEHGSPTHR